MMLSLILMAQAGPIGPPPRPVRDGYHPPINWSCALQASDGLHVIAGTLELEKFVIQEGVFGLAPSIQTEQVRLNIQQSHTPAIVGSHIVNARNDTKFGSTEIFLRNGEFKIQFFTDMSRNGLKRDIRLIVINQKKPHLDSPTPNILGYGTCKSIQGVEK